MRYFFTLFLCFVGYFAISQNKQILYGFDDIPQSLLLNPGSKVIQKKHFGIPFLSQIHFNGGASGVTAYDIFKEGNDDINVRIREKIFEMKNSDFFTATVQLELINIGWRAKNNIYFSGGIYEELDFITYFPKDLAILAWEGNRDYLDYPFNLGEISTTGDLTTVFHFGANKQISDRLTVGARLKIYSSMFSFRSVNNSGTFTTRLGGADSENIYEHIVQNADVTVETSGYAPLRDLDNSSQVTSEILGRSLLGGNLGVGVDLGFSYEIGEAWTISASALDVGAIFHTKDVETYRAHGTYTLDGINLIFPPLSEGESTFPYYDNLEDEVKREIDVDTLNNAYTQFRPLKLNAAINFGFGRFNSSGACDCLNMGGGQLHKQNVGLQLYSIFRPQGPQLAGTLFYHRRFTNFLSAKATYTVDSYSYTNVGLGVSADIGIVNLYLAADNLMSYGNLAKAKSVSLQLGFNIIIDEE
ncbi:DUF5723 family protein [Aequorivita marisscotiae]|uniref:DUF5723 family protein n=1 Tax=Aequorivita marisscotiae TaxID=3040348 RepID=A0ABY8KXA6_9FLAO|nr:DUF5723 family protein [Aequorivita sp. Ant34-E75]WGF92830.1 DUF5723 family protein [Aequorivita sp. Ant34-E75]